jgi:hypothetical protein
MPLYSINSAYKHHYSRMQATYVCLLRNQAYILIKP